MARAAAAVPPLMGEVAERIAFADAALALAGHEVTDPVLRNILEQQARHELTGEEARTAIIDQRIAEAYANPGDFVTLDDDERLLRARRRVA